MNVGGGLPIRLSFCLMVGLANPYLILSQTGTQGKWSSCSFNTGRRSQPLLPSYSSGHHATFMVNDQKLGADASQPFIGCVSLERLCTIVSP